jgi:hypothetical protein
MLPAAMSTPMSGSSPLAHDTVDGLHVAGPRRLAESSRLAVYTLFGAAAGAVPLPWVPDVIASRVRGALAHDIAARHGVSLAPEARAVLAEPWSQKGSRGIAVAALSYVGVRLAMRALARIGPVALAGPLRYGTRTYVLGHLFDRYLENARTERAVRIDVLEAQRVRAAIEGAMLRSFSVNSDNHEEPAPVDDQREPTTAFIDGILGVAAGVPDRLTRRLEAAFDDLLSKADG